MDRKLTAVVLTTIVLGSAFGLTGVGATGADAAANHASSDATVSATATGTATAEPDRAVVSLSTSATGSTASQATDRLAANVSALRDALDNESLAIESVQTTGFNVYRQETNGTTEYVARQSFAVRTTDPGNAGAIVDAAVDAGPTEIDGVRFALSEERQREVRAEAIDAAVTDARSQAESLADSTGLTLGNVQSVSTGSGGFSGPFEDARGTDIDPSPVSVTVSVEVTYNASN